MTPTPPAAGLGAGLPGVHRRRWLAAGAAALLLAGAAAAAGWWLSRPTAAPPPLPADLQDAEVREALDRARQAVLDRPRDARAWGHLAMTLEAHHYEPEADRCFAEADRLDPADVRWPYFRGLYALKYDPDSAPAFLRRAAALRSSPGYRTAVRLRLAEALLERGDLDEAEALFREEWLPEEGNPRAAFGLGLIAAARGDGAAAEKFLTAARDSPTARRAATAQLAALARARGDDAAAARLERESAPLPGDLVAWPDPLVEQIVRLQVGAGARAEEAARLERERRYREAAEVYQRLLKEQPSVRAYVGAGLNLARAGDYGEALPLLREAVGRDPDSPEAHFALALAQFTRAEKARDRSPDAAREWFREAADQARRAAGLKPDHARAYLIWGVALRYLGEPAAAVAPLRQGVACRPTEVDLQLSLGEVLLDLGRTDEAKTYLDNARQLDPADDRVTRALERLGEKK
jgi:tetratricopeptide (TPR) repeat protein